MKETQRDYIKTFLLLNLILSVGILLIVILTFNYYRTSIQIQHMTQQKTTHVTTKPKLVAVVDLKQKVTIPPKIKPTPSRGGGRLEEQEIINNHVREICAKYDNKIEPELVMSLIQRESSYDPMAENGNHLGLMQVSSRWHADRAKKLGVTDFHDPYSNILLGVDYLVELKERYDDPKLVLMLYNMSHNEALRMYKNGKTSTYAKTILANAESYKKGE